MMLSTNTWRHVGSPDPNGKEDDKDSTSSDWVDKVMVNKLESLSREDSLVGCWDVDNSQLPEIFCQSYLPDPPKIYPEQVGKFTGNKKESQDYDAQRNRYEMATTDDSDELEAATSDSSEPDMLWQLNPPKVTNIPNGLAAKAKKSNPRPTRIPEPR